MNYLDTSDRMTLAKELNLSIDEQAIVNELLSRLKRMISTDLYDDICNLTIEGILKIIVDHIEPETIGNNKFRGIESKFANYIRKKYIPVTDMLSAIHELKSVVKHVANKGRHNMDQHMSFNVKMPHIFDHVDTRSIFNSIYNRYANHPGKDYILSNVDNLKEIENSLDDYYRLYLDTSWKKLSRLLKSNFPSIGSIWSEGRSAGWLVMEYEYPTVEELEMLEENIKNYLDYPGSHYTEKYLWKKYDEIINIEKTIKDFIDKTEERLNDFIVETIAAKVDSEMIDLNKELDYDLTKHPRRIENVVHKLAYEWGVDVLVNIRDMLIKTIEDNTTLETDAFEDRLRGSIMKFYGMNMMDPIRRECTGIDHSFIKNLKLTTR